MKETKTTKEIRTSQRRYSPIKHVRESVEGSTTENLITDIHESANAINDRLCTVMRIDDEDLVITLTRFGLWIEWKKNPEYGVSVEAWGRSIAVRGWMGNNIISKEYCDADASRKELASVIDMLVMHDGKL